MNDKIAILGIVEILSSLSCGIVILFLTYRSLRVYGNKKLHVTPDNLAYNIVIAAVMFSVGMTVKGVIDPILSSYRLLVASEMSTTQVLLNFLAFGGAYIAIAYVWGMLVAYLGVLIYGNLTPLKEREEIQKNNIGVAILISVIIIVLNLMTSGGIILFIESFIPYPTLPPMGGL